MPFSLITTFNVNPGFSEVQDSYFDGQYLYIADGRGGLYVYSFDGTTATLIDSHDNGGQYEGVRLYNGFIIVSDNVDGLLAYSFDGTNLNLEASIDDGGFYEKLWIDGDNIFVPRTGSGLSVYTFNGVAFNLEATQAAGATNWNSVVVRGGYVYAGTSDGGIRVYTYAGGVFTFVASYASATAIYALAECDNGRLLVSQYIGPFAYDNTLRLLEFDGAAFTVLQSIENDANQYQAYWDNGRLLVARASGGAGGARFFVYTIANNLLNEEYEYEISTGGEIARPYAYSEYGFHGNHRDAYIFQISRWLFTGDFDWSPKNRKAPVLAEFEDQSSVRFR